MKIYQASGDNPKYPCQIVVAYDEDEEQALAAVYLADSHQDAHFCGETALEKAIAYAVYLTTTKLLSLFGLFSLRVAGHDRPETTSPGTYAFEKWQYISELLEKVQAIATVLVKFLKETGVQIDDLVQTDRIVPDTDLIRNLSNLEYIQKWILEATNALTLLQAITGLDAHTSVIRVSSP